MTQKAPEMQTSHAILMLSGKYVLQLRDDKPTISAPGEWSLFGGALDKDEAPADGVKREIFEELGIEPAEYIPLWSDDYYAPFEKKMVRTWFFAASVDDIWKTHVLNEGREVKAFAFDELNRIKVPEVMKKNIERYQREYGGSK